MSGMFRGSKFNQDISKWDVSNVDEMGWMFEDSQFNQDISNWDVSNVTECFSMFDNSPFDGDLSRWHFNEHAWVEEHLWDLMHKGKNSKRTSDLS